MRQEEDLPPGPLPEGKGRKKPSLLTGGEQDLRKLEASGVSEEASSAFTPSLQGGGRGVGSSAGGVGSADDYVLMDCGPSLGVLTLNALAAADEVFIPLQPHFLALHGLSKLFETTALVAKRINPRLKVTGIVVCMYESTTNFTHEVILDLEEFLA